MTTQAQLAWPWLPAERAALEAVAATLGARPVALGGPTSLRCHGVTRDLERPVLVDGASPEGPARPIADGFRWYDLAEEGPLLRAAVRSAVRFAHTPLPVVTMPWWVTLALCDSSEDPRPALGMALHAGVVPLDETRQLVTLRAGRGARHLLDDLIADAEWALMRARYAGSEGVH